MDKQVSPYYTPEDDKQQTVANTDDKDDRKGV